MMQTLLLWWILFYRRWISGRGPMRRVRCTFHHGETCSAFGLRAAREAPSFRVAWGRIRRRTRRCRNASIYDCSPPGGPRALGWGSDHDRPLDELLAELSADDERPEARATVLAARLAVARFRGDLIDLAQVAPHRALLPPAQIVLRNAARERERAWLPRLRFRRAGRPRHARLPGEVAGGLWRTEA